MLERDGHGHRMLRFGRELSPRPDPACGVEDWKQANPAKIRAALERAMALPWGGWLVVDSSRRIGERPQSYWVDGHELVAWRGVAGPVVATNCCPHMGAPLSTGRARHGKLVCPWHGLELGVEERGAFRPLEVHDDGHLLWVRPGDPDAKVPRPILPDRPARALSGCIRLLARCEPRDVIANRLDPWHGIHLHPHSFRRLRVLELGEDRIMLRVAFRVAGPLCVEVDAAFHCADPNTIVMTIVDGDGKGSVVETHATPTGHGMTSIVELTLATSDRPGFGLVLSASSFVRPLLERAARRLWTEDAAYAERTASLREGKSARLPVR